MLLPNEQTPDLDLPLTIDARFELSSQTPDSFTMLIFYRGMHCPVCKDYLETIGSRLSELTDRGVSPFAICMDDEDRAMTVEKEWKTHDLPLAYGLSEDEARKWGLYISEGREDSKEPKLFSEPGLFLLRPDRTLYFAQVQSGPWTRPSLDDLTKALDTIKKLDYPARGTLTAKSTEPA